MYYLIGEQSCNNSIMSACGLRKKKALPPARLKQAYANFLAQYQPNIPFHSELKTKIVANKKIEDKLMAVFGQPSILDDLDRYADSGFLMNGPAYRPVIQKEVKYLRSFFKEHYSLEPEFWNAFQLVINYIICPLSEYSSGGSDSNFIGMLFICSPSEISQVDLYELLIHEFTHNVMFLDELTTPHYVNDLDLVKKQNYAVASISGMRRPLDKVLHSVVIASEVLLHREHVIGHNHSTYVHPPTKKLVSNIRRSIRSIRQLKNYDSLIASRGKELLKICEKTISHF